jgi:hypothetical protein
VRAAHGAARSRPLGEERCARGAGRGGDRQDGVARLRGRACGGDDGRTGARNRVGGRARVLGTARALLALARPARAHSRASGRRAASSARPRANRCARPLLGRRRDARPAGRLWRGPPVTRRRGRRALARSLLAGRPAVRDQAARGRPRSARLRRPRGGGADLRGSRGRLDLVDRPGARGRNRPAPQEPSGRGRTAGRRPTATRSP